LAAGVTTGQNNPGTIETRKSALEAAMNLEVITRQPASVSHSTPLLFVHGAWHGAWCWDEYFLPYFAEHGYAAHALSWRGHGNSEGGDRLRWTRVADYVEDVRQVAAGLAATPVIIGHSLGGFVTQHYLAKYSAPAAVLMASIPHFGTLPYFTRFALRHPVAFLKTNLTFTPYHFVASPELVGEGFFSADMPADKVAAYFAKIQNEAYGAALDAILFNLPHPAKVRTPLLILGAANDAVFPPHEVQATARAYNTTAEIFPDMAHDMMLEAGWQKVADRILTWLNERGL
jgi:pimeloyl-ACP methyl ester carboxylesterase